MKRLFFSFLVILLAAGLNSCFTKDSMVPAPERGDVRVDTIAMTASYVYQVYFRLDSGIVTSTNQRTDCDLGFECSPQGYHIILNTADFMKIADMGVRNFGENIDTTGSKWKFDKSDGNPDSIATGTWFKVVNGDTVSNGHIWALDLGRDTAGLHLGLKQVIFDSLNNGTYYFRIAGISGGNFSRGAVHKNGTVNYLYYGIRAGGIVVSLEPPKKDYDLLFTQYTTLLFTSDGAAYPYLVTGVLANPNGVKIAVDTLDSFAAIDLTAARTMIYSIVRDAIGYDWKVYNFTANSYTVRPNLSFVLAGTDGFYYKLRFTSFYNAGVKGYPVIETARL